MIVIEKFDHFFAKTHLEVYVAAQHFLGSAGAVPANVQERSRC
jgi:hypothetical protein